MSQPPSFWLDADPDRGDELLEAALIAFGAAPIRVAVWLFQTPRGVPPQVERIAAGPSPIKGSESELAGHGFLFRVDAASSAGLLEFVQANDVMHLEVECERQIQLAAYDAFEQVFVWDKFTPQLMTQLKHSGVIAGYEKIEE
jgi:hypothetical protein